MKEDFKVTAIPFGDGLISANIHKIDDKGFAIVFYFLEPPKKCGDEVLESDKKILLPELFNSMLFKNKKSVEVVIDWLEHIKQKFIEEENKATV
jgi:hypothetical protein